MKPVVLAFSEGSTPPSASLPRRDSGTPGGHGHGGQRRTRRRGAGGAGRARGGAGRRRPRLVDARRTYFDAVLRFLVFGNVKEGGLYPLCVGAERGVQAREVAGPRARSAATRVAHGSTGAGNDQVRFEVALRACAPSSRCSRPSADEARSRAEELAYLAARARCPPAHGAAYSVNRGLWGTRSAAGDAVQRDPLPSPPGSDPGRLRRPAAAERAHARLQRGRPDAWDGRSSTRGADRARGADGGALRDRPRHPPRGDDPRPQGPRRLRGPAAETSSSPPRAGEARAHRQAGAPQGSRGRDLRRAGARRLRHRSRGAGCGSPPGVEPGARHGAVFLSPPGIGLAWRAWPRPTP
jgi:hypothetical protein